MAGEDRGEMGNGEVAYNGGMGRGEYHIFYDGTCGLCHRSKAWLEARDVRGVFRFVDSRDPAAMGHHPEVTAKEAEGQIVVVSPGGEKRGGYDGIIMLMREMKGWRIVRPALAVWGIRGVGRRVYRWVAKRRHQFFGRVACESGACRI
jgi:predicted DCC family thiol-disulfide oxidoreductase YuxK